MKELKNFIAYLIPHKRVFGGALALSMVYGVSSGAGIPIVFEKVYQKFFESGVESHTSLEIWLAAALLPAAFTIRGISGYFSAYLFGYCGQRYIQALRRDLFAKLQELPLSYFEKQKRGDLISRILSDSNQLSAGVMELATEGILQPFIAISALGTIVYLSVANDIWVFLLALVATLPLVIMPVRLISRKLGFRSKRGMEATAEVTGKISENLNALREIRAYNMQQAQRLSFGQSLEKLFVESLKLIKYQRMNQPIMEFVSALVVSATFLIALKGGIGFSVFFAIGMALYFFFDPVKRIARAVNKFATIKPAFARLNEILNEPLRLRDPDSPELIHKPQGALALKHVSFAYGDAPILEDFTLDIPPRQSVAFVGPSGAGKTTVINLLMRFYDTNAGSVTLDGIDVRHMSRHHLREHLALVSQNPVIFNTTVLENIALGRPGSSRGDIEQAARKAHAHEFIVKMENGYDTPVGEDGGRLSGGQRQRIALARAFLKGAPVVILDEATSALDTDSEQKIKEALRALMREKTVIAISHRFSLIEEFDTICVLDKGKLVATGPHKNLYRKNALYTRLYDQYAAKG